MATKSEAVARRRVGIVGYGPLGQYLAHAILTDTSVSEQLELAFVWNRTISKVTDDKLVPSECVLEKLEEFESMRADLIVEVAHPKITLNFGPKFLQNADYMVGSPTCFANQATEDAIREAIGSNAGNHGCYIPSGALWAAQDIKKMADRGDLMGLTITMAKPPHSFKVNGRVKDTLDAAVASNTQGETILYEGPVRELCPMAPNNVNTMACCALAGHTLGFDGVVGKLVADSSLEAHVVSVDVVGPKKAGGEHFRVSSTRYNPCKRGAVTGNATYASFVSSMLRAQGLGKGMHFA